MAGGKNSPKIDETKIEKKKRINILKQKIFDMSD